MFNIHIELEKWKLNKEYNLYVSTLGRVKDIKKKIIEPVINSCGYFVVKVDNKVIAVHSLVMLTFKGQRQEGMTIDHLNSNRRDNRLKNLEYVTQEENLNRANNKLLNSFDDDSSIEDVNEFFDLLAQHKIYSIKHLKDILSTKAVIEIIKKSSNKNRIVARDAASWARKYLLTHDDGSVADIKTFCYKVEVFAKMNKEYCGYKLSMCNNEIIGMRVH